MSSSADRSSESDDNRGARTFGEVLARTDRQDTVVKAAQALRRHVPGGDPTSLDRRDLRGSDRIAGLIEQVRAEHPSAVRELGLAAVQVWQSIAPKRKDTEIETGPVTILFTDLVGFSTWALKVGDDKVLQLLRAVDRASEDIIAGRGGRVVKSLGDGLMAVFADPAEAIWAAHETASAVSAITIDGYRPQLRCGLHTGTPRKVGEDYLGVDVNIAARISAAAGAGEVLASAASLEGADESRFTKRNKRFRAKGAPKDLVVYSVLPRYEA